ncbi:MAG: hypothetical protein IPI34_00035 [bacterium]|nr:hypothetical protein [bacterium]
MRDLLHRLNPAVPRRVLPLIAGVLWGMVALMLMTRATIWLLGARPLPGLAAAAAGILMAVVLIPRAFRPLVAKNLRRLADRPDPACLFSTFPWRSWAMVLVMSVGGVLLRHSDLPRLLLAAPYLGMGLSLGAGALVYLRRRPLPSL